MRHRFFDSVLAGCMRLLVPSKIRSDPMASIRCMMIAVLPSLYILAAWIVLYRLPHRLQPPAWNLYVYLTFPFLIRITGSYSLVAWIFMLFQSGSSLFVLTVVHPTVSVAITLMFVPLVACLFSGRRAGVAFGIFALYILIAGHYQLVPFHGEFAPPPRAVLRSWMSPAQARNWAMTILLIGLHRLIHWGIFRREALIVSGQQQAFASIWYLVQPFSPFCFSFGFPVFIACRCVCVCVVFRHSATTVHTAGLFPIRSNSSAPHFLLWSFSILSSTMSRHAWALLADEDATGGSFVCV